MKSAGEGIVTLRSATLEDAGDIAEIWHLGWRDGHLGFVPQALIAVRTEDSFRTRALARLADTTVATVDETVAGFVMRVNDEVEQVYVGAAYRGKGIADILIAEAERQVRAGGFKVAWLAVVAGNKRARAFYKRAGWTDQGPFDYQAGSEGGSISVPAHRYVKLI